MRKARATEALIRSSHRGFCQWTRNSSTALGSPNVFKPHSLTSIRRHPQTFVEFDASPQFVPISINNQCRTASSSVDPGALRRTGLYDLHVSKGGKMVPFGGYSMPVQYSDLSVGESHKWTREKASLFDVGHMVQHHISGPNATAFLEKVTPSSLAALQPYHSALSCFLHPATGGIVDDTVIARLGPEMFYLVTNAGCREKDVEYLTEQIQPYQSYGGGGVNWTILEDWGLIALQGPLSAELLKSTLGGLNDFDLTQLYFGQCTHIPINLRDGTDPVPLLVSRGGYTGEDGVEISIPPDGVAKVTEHLLNSAGPDRLRLAGLGARDSLRLEAGMCLYGHDLDDTTTPVEAGLSWVIHKDRRTAGGFHGDDAILQELRPVKDGGGPSRRRIGLIVDGAPAREGAEIVAEAGGKLIGKVTSGCPSPTLGQNIAMGYVESGNHKVGTEVGVVVRGKRRKATVVKMPFVATRYWKQKVGLAPG